MTNDTCNFTLTHQNSEESSSFCWWKSIPEFKSPYDSSSSSSSSMFKVLREMERLRMISEQGVDELKHKLMIYKSGDFWLPIGGIKKEEMDIPPIITVLLVGLSGSGKSSLVNFMYSVLGRSGLIPFSQTSSTFVFFISLPALIPKSVFIFPFRNVDCR